jgi:hypothetical protein
MKIARLVLAAGVSLAAFAGLSAAEFTSDSNSDFGQQWMAHYYQNPQPDKLITAVMDLGQSGYFATAANRETAMGFIATVMQRNPDYVPQWLAASRRVLSNGGQRIIAAAAWYAGYPAGAREIHRLGEADDSSLRDQVEPLIAGQTPGPMVARSITSEPSLNLEWGAFLASGDRQYITNVFVALGSNEPGLASTARFRLAEKAAADPQVMQICQSELARQPAAVRASFEAALNEQPERKPGA